MLDADRLAVYRWVAPLAVGARVLHLSSGCRDAAAVLTEAGGQEVVAADPDRGRLELDDASFQLVIAIGAAAASYSENGTLDELFRVTAPDGWLLMSVTEGGPAEVLRERLLTRFGQVSTARRRTLIGSGIVPRDRTHQGPGTTFQVHVLPGQQSLREGEEVFLLAGTSGPARSPAVLLEEAAVVRQWIECWKAQRAAEEALQDRVRELEQRLAERGQLQARLRAAQQALEARTATLEQGVQEAIAETAGPFEATAGWWLTAPLRRGLGLDRRRLRGG